MTSAALSSYLRRAAPVLVLLAALTWAGCEESVDAVVGTDKTFTLYGALTPETDTQWVRVYPIENRLVPTENEPLPASLVSENLETGSTRTWRDSVITEPDGRFAHVYWAPFRAEYGRTYRLTVERTSEGQGSSRVEAKVPDSSRIELGEAEVLGSARQNVFIRGNIPHLTKVQVVYDVKFGPGQLAATTTEVALDYDDAPERTDDGWKMLIALSRDFDRVQQRLQERGIFNQTFGVILIEMRIEMLAVNDAWDPPGGTFDAELLVQPGTMSNVEDGFGFVGAGYGLEHEYLPPDSVLQDAGFRTR